MVIKSRLYNLRLVIAGRTLQILQTELTLGKFRKHIRHIHVPTFNTSSSLPFVLIKHGKGGGCSISVPLIPAFLRFFITMMANAPLF